MAATEAIWIVIITITKKTREENNANLVNHISRY